MSLHIYEVLKKRYRREKRLYQCLLAVAFTLTLVGFFNKEGMGTLLLKKMYLEHKAKKLEDENSRLKGDMDNLMPPCMKKGEFVVTAYEKSKRSCNKWAKYGKTSSGTIPAAFRTAAVDTSVIKKGSLIYARGIGWMIAEDKGADIKGKRLDIFMDSVTDAMTFGRKKATVFYQSSKCFKELLNERKYASMMDDAIAQVTPD